MKTRTLLLRFLDDRARCAAELRQADKDAIAAALVATDKAAALALKVSEDAKNRADAAWKYAITSIIAIAAVVIGYIALGRH